MIEIHEQARNTAAVLAQASAAPPAAPAAAPAGGQDFAASLDQAMAAATSTPAAAAPSPPAAATPAAAPVAAATTVGTNSAGQIVSDFVLGSQVFAGDDNCYASTATGFFQGQPSATYYAGTGQGISLSEISEAFYGAAGAGNQQAMAAIMAANPSVTWPADPTTPLPVGTRLTIPDMSGTITGAF